MSSHSRLFLKRKTNLEQSEKELRQSLDDVSTKSEETLLGFLRSFGIVLLGAGIAYGAYRIFSRNRYNEEPEENEKITQVKRKTNRFVNHLTDRLLDAGLVTLLTRISRSDKGKD